MSEISENIFEAFPEESMEVLAHMIGHIRISPCLPVELCELLNKRSNPAEQIAQAPSFWLDGAKDLQFFDSGRISLLACLKMLGLSGDDEVLIVKTTDGTYISGCVTHTIEKICRWSQEPSPKTKLVLVIHEFGFACPHKKFKAFQEKGIPILEDCAYALGTRIEEGDIGRYGDFALYSMTKYYPVPFGGILASKEKISEKAALLKVSLKGRNLLETVINNALVHHKGWNHKRRQNWEFFTGRIAPHQLRPYFDLDPTTVPGTFLFKTSNDFHGESAKLRLNMAGVEATEYYNQSGFYFPVHQFLTSYEKEYILHYLFKYS